MVDGPGKHAHCFGARADTAALGRTSPLSPIFAAPATPPINDLAVCTIPLPMPTSNLSQPRTTDYTHVHHLMIMVSSAGDRDREGHAGNAQHGLRPGLHVAAGLLRRLSCA